MPTKASENFGSVGDEFSFAVTLEEPLEIVGDEGCDAIAAAGFEADVFGDTDGVVVAPVDDGGRRVRRTRASRAGDLTCGRWRRPPSRLRGARGREAKMRRRSR